MFRATLAVLLGGCLLTAASGGAVYRTVHGGAVEPRDLSRAPSEDLLRVYAELRQLRAGDQGALTENLVLNGQTRRLGFLSIRGPTTFTADIPLPFQPEKVYLDEYHSILSTIKQ